MTKARPRRPLDDEDQSTLERLVSHLRRATDEDLDLFYESLHSAAMAMLEGVDQEEWKTLDDVPPLFVVAMEMRDLTGHEKRRRQDAIRYAEADMNDGHLVEVGFGDAAGTYGAYCLPYEEFCWEGADRETVEEALKDGRRHYSGSEPQVNPSCRT